MKIFQFVLGALSLFGLGTRVDAAALFAATAAGGPGTLYTLNPATGGLLQNIGPLNDAAGGNFGITGLAFHPTTGVLYGSTSNSVAGSEARLVTINPATAQVSLVGSFNAGPVNGSGTPATMADLAFDPAGTLYGVASIGGPQLYSINTTTGQATVIGTTGLTSTSGGGLGISPGGVFYGTPTSTRFGTYNSVTGAFTNIVNPTKPVGGAYAALAFDGSVLYGLDLGPDSAGKPTELVTFNLATGAVTSVGGSIAQLDAIAFQRVIPEPGSLALLLVGVVALATKRSEKTR